jgi:hypothetical protein
MAVMILTCLIDLQKITEAPITKLFQELGGV